MAPDRRIVGKESLLAMVEGDSDSDGAEGSSVNGVMEDVSRPLEDGEVSGKSVRGSGREAANNHVRNCSNSKGSSEAKVGTKGLMSGGLVSVEGGGPGEREEITSLGFGLNRELGSNLDGSDMVFGVGLHLGESDMSLINGRVKRMETLGLFDSGNVSGGGEKPKFVDGERAR